MRFLGYGKNEEGEITISKKWHARYKSLQDFVLCGADRPYFLDSMTCPFTWFSVFCLLILPLILPFRGIITLCTLSHKVLVMLSEALDRFVCEPLFKSFVGDLNDSQVYSMENWSSMSTYYRDRGDLAKINKYKKRLEMFKKIHGENWKKMIADSKARHIFEKAKYEKIERDRIAARRLLDSEKRKKKEASLEANRKRILKIVKATEFLVPYLVFAVTCCALVGVGYWCLSFYSWIMEIWNPTYSKRAMTILIGVSLGVGGVFFLFFLVSLYQKCDLSFKCPKSVSIVGSVVAKPFIVIGRCFKKIFEYFGEIIDIFSELKNYCPPLRVEDDE